MEIKGFRINATDKADLNGCDNELCVETYGCGISIYRTDNDYYGCGHAEDSIFISREEARELAEAITELLK